MTGARRGALALAAVVVTALAVPGSAGAAVTIGSDLAPPAANANSCAPAPCTLHNSAIAGSVTKAPFDGVIVRWRMRPTAIGAGTPVALRTIREPQVFFFTATGTDAEVAPAVNSDTTLTFESRLPISQGDGIALELGGFALVSTASQPGVTWMQWTPPLQEGQTRSPSVTAGGNGPEVLVNADVEPDADADGFGDETQDACPGQAGPDGGCDRSDPETTITAGPKSKVKKKAATFEFAGTDARAVAGFECSLNGAAYSACSSPLQVKAKKGKNTFSVRALDAAGNADGSPATQTWKVRKKKKR